VRGRRAQVTVIERLQVRTKLDLPLHWKQIVTWFTSRHPDAIKLGCAMPPLFEVRKLRIRHPDGARSETPWSIAFNQDAYFLDSLGWWQVRKEDDVLIV